MYGPYVSLMESIAAAFQFKDRLPPLFPSIDDNESEIGSELSYRFCLGESS
jgi:hypothetical protein